MKDTLDVDALAQEIRRVDGKHSLGAGQLAEALMPFLSSPLSPSGEAEPVAWRVVTNNTAWSFYRTREEAERGAHNRLTYVKGCTSAQVEPLYLLENLASKP